VAESKAFRLTTASREVDPADKKGGYPAGDKTAAQMGPPPPSWLRPAGSASGTGKK
jgi:hypothetical protein